tara:strand:+ start:415 stop:777 length:363 start_codon:yes stop_codon:yes gene_type:complete
MVATAYSTATEAITISATATGADATVVYTCPANHDTTVDLLHISNNNNASKKIYVQFFHLEDTTYHYILKNYALAGNSAINLFNSAPLHLHAGDKIVMYGQTTNTMEALISCKQFFNPAR